MSALAPGAPFNFRMMRLAREIRGLTQTALAKQAGLPQARVSRIESGQLEPTTTELNSLLEVLDFPAEFVAEPGAPAAVPMFRKRAIRSVRKLAALQARLNIAVLAAQRILDAGIEIDPPQYFSEPGAFAPDQGALAAHELRRAWRLPVGRIDNVTALIESVAGVVLPVDFGTDDATAAFISTPSDGRYWFLVNTRETAGDRVRLSLAHELGHAVLHQMLPAHGETEFELQAFTFATNLLLPPDEFDAQVPYDALTLAQARALKRSYGVSIQAIVRAAHDRRRITRDRYTSLFKQISSRHWRLVEPDPVPLEAAQLWPDVLRVHRSEHAYTDEELARIARVDVRLLADLFPDEIRAPRHLRAVTSAKVSGRPRLA